MPRKKRIPGYLLHKSSGHARVIIDGKEHWLGPYGSEESRIRYDKLIAEYQLKHGGSTARATITIAQLCVAYIEHAKVYYQKNGKQTSEVSTIQAALRVLVARFSRLRVSEFGPLKLKDVRDQMIAKGWVRSSINQQVKRIVRVLSWGVENEVVPPSIAEACRQVKGLSKGRSAAREAAPVLPVPVDRILAIKSFVRPAVWGMIELQLATGMRPGEVRTLRLSNLNPAGEVWEYVPSSHKTEHHEIDRRIFVGPRGQEVVSRFPVIDESRFVFAADTEGFRCYTKDSYNRAITRGSKKAGVDPWSPNQLRHNSATDLRAKVGIEATRTVLGHKSAGTTEIYAEQDFEAARKVMATYG